ncbi:endonuclease/exonuclease/phosphatase family protein [Yinghuangia aomiensis]
MTVLRVATFNVLHGMSLDDGTAGPGQLAEALSALDADIVALQEVDRHQARSQGADQAAVAAKALGAEHWRFLAAVHGVPAPVSEVAGGCREPGAARVRAGPGRRGRPFVRHRPGLPPAGTALAGAAVPGGAVRAAAARAGPSGADPGCRTSRGPCWPRWSRGRPGR